MSKSNLFDMATGRDIKKSHPATPAKNPSGKSTSKVSYLPDEEEKIVALNRELAELNQHAIKAKGLLDQAKSAGLSDTFVAAAQQELDACNAKIKSVKAEKAKIDADAKKRAEEAAAEPSVDLDLFRAPESGELSSSSPATSEITIGSIIAAMEKNPKLRKAVAAYLAAAE